jgi:acyl-CoA hydrolase/RimJ/RimL family protein N-acetyltransferase
MRDVSRTSHYRERVTTAHRALSRLRSGNTVFVESGCACPTLLLEALRNIKGPIGDIEILHGMMLGVEGSAETVCSGRLRHNAYFVGQEICQALIEGRADYLPMFSSEIERFFSTGRLPVDVALIQVRPPDEGGFCNLGISVGATLPAIKAARYVVAEVNPAMPRTFGSTTVHVDSIDAFVESDRPLLELEPTPIDDVSRQIAHHCLRLIEDGAVLRMGCNAVAAALAEELIAARRRDLGIHSDTFTEPMMDLVRAGVVTNVRNVVYPNRSVACRCMGTQELYDFVHMNPQIELHSTTEICDPLRIAREHRMVSLIRARQVDLAGQVSDGSLVRGFTGGFAGRSDFLHGAAVYRRGRSIVVMPSTTADGTGSNIRMFLDQGAIVLNSAAEAHYVVTEFGVAALHGRTVRERAISLIAIAHPRFRDELMSTAKMHCYVYQDQVPPRPDQAVYPQHAETEIPLNEWTKITLRPAVPGDERIVQNFIYGLSDHSIHYRFHGQMHTMNHRQVQHFVNVDYTDTMTFLAFLADDTESEQMIAMGQYLRYPDSNRAEVAFITHEDYQNQGVATEILRALVRYARQQGLEGFFAEVLQGNHAMLKVFQKSTLAMRTSFDDGLYTVEMDL